FILKVMAALPVCLMSTLLVFTWALPAVVLPELSLSNSTLVLTSQEASWFASMPFFVSIPGCLLGGPLSDRVGPRRLMLVLTPLLAGSTALMGVSNWSGLRQVVGVSQVFLLLVTRVIQVHSKVV
ncbi:putative Major Facilitator Superfamily-like protein 1, partial [Homarus americanus]